jgi:hypothetical protein
MLTTSPACSARHSSKRMVRASTRAVSPSREISQELGLTHQEPIRSIVAVGRSMKNRLCRCGRKPLGVADYNNTCVQRRYASRAIANTASFQKYSECFRPSSGLPGSRLDIVQQRREFQTT